MEGKLVVSEDGDVSLSVPQFAASEWLEQFITSLVQHRMPDEPRDEDVRFADDNTQHPLGRKIALGDGDRGSVYRIKDNVVTEVNRRGRSGRFTISVLEVTKNPDQKYLPAAYTITFWNGDGQIQSSSTTQDSWVRVGNFDLPQRTLQISTGDDRRDVRQIEFHNHKPNQPGQSKTR